jgi:hypothetical protein
MSESINPVDRVLNLIFTDRKQVNVDNVFSLATSDNHGKYFIKEFLKRLSTRSEFASESKEAFEILEKMTELFTEKQAKILITPADQKIYDWILVDIFIQALHQNHKKTIDIIQKTLSPQLQSSAIEIYSLNLAQADDQVVQLIRAKQIEILESLNDYKAITEQLIETLKQPMYLFVSKIASKGYIEYLYS